LPRFNSVIIGHISRTKSAERPKADSNDVVGLSTAIIDLQEKGMVATPIFMALTLAIIEMAQTDPENQQIHLESAAAILSAAVESNRAGKVACMFDAIINSN
jgi:hypothetical protein